MLALAAVNFAWQLGASSFFVDEVLSVQAASHGLGGVVHAVVHTEITPPAYFLFQHEWLLRTGSHAEWVARLPSLLCGVALVGAIAWLAWLINRRAGVALGAAALAAVSPFVLQYAQLAQGYLFAALALTLSVCCFLQAERLRRTAWIVGAGAAAVVAMCINYTAVIAVGLLCMWILRSRTPPTARPRTWFAAVCGLAAVLLAPLFVIQWHNTPGRHGVGGAAGLTLANAAQLARAPFAGRASALPALALAVTVVPLLVLAMRCPRSDRSVWPLILGLAVAEPVALLALSAFGARVALPRYAAVAVPFMIVGVSAGVAAMPRPLAILAAVALAVAATAGLRDAHQGHSFYADARGAVDFIKSHQTPGDAVVSPTGPVVAVPLAYYGLDRLRPVPPYAFSGSLAAARLIAARHRLWIVSPLPDSESASRLLAFERPLAARFGYRARIARVFDSAVPLGVVGWVPGRP